MKTHYICYQQNPLDFWTGMIDPTSTRLRLNEEAFDFYYNANATVEVIFWIAWQIIEEWLFYMPWDVFSRIWYVCKIEANWNTYVLLEWDNYRPNITFDVIRLDENFNRIYD